MAGLAFVQQSLAANVRHLLEDSSRGHNGLWAVGSRFRGDPQCHFASTLSC